MRRLLYGAMAGIALATASIASAAVLVTGVTNLNNPDPSAPGSQYTVGDTTTINFGQNPVGPGAFASGFNFSNLVPGVYNFVLGSSTPGVSFSTASLSGSDIGTLDFNVLHTSSPASLYLSNVTLSANTTYSLSFAGSTNSQSTGAFVGNLTINPVPEPATWAMMLVGFAGIGLTVGRRRPRTIAQVA